MARWSRRWRSKRFVAERRAVVLLSGGADSATTLAVARRDGREAYCLTADYGQRQRWEIEGARALARAFSARRHLVLSLDSRLFAGSALVDRASSSPYVPARNVVLLALALAWAEVVDADELYIGTTPGGHPDTRPAFIETFERAANLGTRTGSAGGKRLRIRTPLAHLAKTDVIRLGLELGVDFALTRSCYFPSDADESCGRCDACRPRLEAFAELGLTDPVPYASA